MSKKTFSFRAGAVLASLAAAALLTGASAAWAQVKGAHGALSATTIPQGEVDALMGNFSASTRAFTTAPDGARLYHSICQACHMDQGQGAKADGFYPALARNPHLATGHYPVAVLLNGMHGMPSFADRLNDEQVAAVVNYVRSNFGNAYPDPIKPEDVQTMRATVNK